MRTGCVLKQTMGSLHTARGREGPDVVLPQGGLLREDTDLQPGETLLRSIPGQQRGVMVCEWLSDPYSETITPAETRRS